MSNLIHLLTLLLQNAPEGTLQAGNLTAFELTHYLSGSSKAMQTTLTRCLQLFADRPDFLREAFVQNEALHFVARQVNDRVYMALKPAT